MSVVLSLEPTLYERLGGEAAISGAVDDFYRRILGDALLAPFFEGKDMGALRQHQTRFLMQIAGGPKQYAGRTVRAAHRGLDLRAEHFDAVAGHLSATLTDAGVAEAERTEVLTAVASLRADVLNQ